MGAGMRAFVFAGVLGGFTTFSSFGLDTFTLAQGGRAGAAAVNVTIQVVWGSRSSRPATGGKPSH